MVLGTFPARNRAVSHPPYQRTKTEQARFDSRSIFPWLSLQLTWPSENRQLDVFQTRGTIVEKFSARVRSSIHMPDGFSLVNHARLCRTAKKNRAPITPISSSARRRKKQPLRKKASRCRNDSQRFKTRCSAGSGKESRIF